jgi:pimeloyl-ACP methyl ester carboxylesterase
MRTRAAVFTFVLAMAMVLSGCAQYASVSERRPHYYPLSTTVGALVSAERAIVKALRAERREPMVALGEYLSAAKAAFDELQRKPGDAVALANYNFAVARVLGTIKEGRVDLWAGPVRIPATGGDFTLTFKRDPRPEWNPTLYNFVPADEFDVRGKYVTERSVKEGWGAPIVAIGREMNKDMKANFSLPRTFYGVTAVIRFEGRRAILSLEDPLSAERIRVGGRMVPLAADFTVPLAVMLASANPKRYEIPRLLRPGKFAETARISRLQPYDPNKTVVLVVHGLMDTAATWTPMINALRSDERIRKSCQFWLFSYPSGYPYPYSALLLRRELDAIEKKYPLRKPMVVIGHSMGGCIARLLITDTGDRVWMEMFNRKPADVPLSAESRRLIEDSLIFRKRSEVGRVIFVSAPLRGSEMAINPIGRIGSMLVAAPRALLNAGADVIKSVTFQSDDLKLKRMPNSVDTLAPNNRFVRAINKVPVAEVIPYHVICGDRGLGGNKDHTKPVMSDGIVPHWSSHMPGARSELIVPSDHSAHQNREAIAEVKRILRLNAEGSVR